MSEHKLKPQLLQLSQAGQVTLCKDADADCAEFTDDDARHCAGNPEYEPKVGYCPFAGW